MNANGTTGPARLLMGVLLLGLVAMKTDGARAETSESCLEPLSLIADRMEDADEVTRRKVNELVEDAKLLCEEDKAALAQEKFARALQLALGPEEGPIER